ncbi:hypothetical protein T459_28045 [Capsicum annuum]|uniref:Glycoside hydrolase family 3 N-terminal domain-containing protein n=1 Tax=Capsicum annuum TaxID=4072 RepID=A0A2G2YFN0_CAPAN|nr:hypothetical protein T459_28045 [Capsicum annuum]
MWEASLRLFSHMTRRFMDASLCSCERLAEDGFKRGCGRPKKFVYLSRAQDGCSDGWVAAVKLKDRSSRGTDMGLLITDWEALDRLTDPNGCDYRQSIKSSINTGIDMVMVPFRYELFLTEMLSLVELGKIPMTRIDDAVELILRDKFVAGLFSCYEAALDLVKDRNLEMLIDSCLEGQEIIRKLKNFVSVGSLAALRKNRY